MEYPPPPEHWIRWLECWRGVPFVWTRWRRRHDDWTHDHCFCCNAYISDWRDRDPYDKPGPVEGGCYRFAFYAENSDATYAWICRSCFKRVQKAAGLIRQTKKRHRDG